VIVTSVEHGTSAGCEEGTPVAGTGAIVAGTGAIVAEAGAPVARTGTLVAAIGELVAGSGAFVVGPVGNKEGSLVAGREGDETGALVAGRGAFVIVGALVTGTVGVGRGEELKTIVSVSWHMSPFGVVAFTLMVAVFSAMMQTSTLTTGDSMVHCPDDKSSSSGIATSRSLKLNLAVLTSTGSSPLLQISAVYVIDWRQLVF
jgi:hypothetical protein